MCGTRCQRDAMSSVKPGQAHGRRLPLEYVVARGAVMACCTGDARKECQRALNAPLNRHNLRWPRTFGCVSEGASRCGEGHQLNCPSDHPGLSGRAASSPLSRDVEDTGGPGRFVATDGPTGQARGGARALSLRNWPSRRERRQAECPSRRCYEMPIYQKSLDGKLVAFDEVVPKTDKNLRRRNPHDGLGGP